MNSVVAEFRSEVRPFARKVFSIGAILTITFLCLGTFIQTTTQVFSSYVDLIFVTLSIPAFCSVVILFCFIASWLFPVQILRDGLRCYDIGSQYRVLRWNDVTQVQIVYIYGLPYLLIAGADLRQPLTLPLWLENLGKFLAIAESEAGNDNLVVLGLKDYLN